jgi:hypothetical protein
MYPTILVPLKYFDITSAVRTKTLYVPTYNETYNMKRLSGTDHLKPRTSNTELFTVASHNIVAQILCKYVSSVQAIYLQNFALTDVYYTYTSKFNRIWMLN